MRDNEGCSFLLIIVMNSKTKTIIKVLQAGQSDINVNGLDQLGQLIAIECSLFLYLCDFVFIRNDIEVY